MTENGFATSNESTPLRSTNTLTPTAVPLHSMQDFVIMHESKQVHTTFRFSEFSCRDRLHQIGHLMDTHCGKMLFTTIKVDAARNLSRQDLFCFYKLIRVQHSELLLSGLVYVYLSKFLFTFLTYKNLTRNI